MCNYKLSGNLYKVTNNLEEPPIECSNCFRGLQRWVLWDREVVKNDSEILSSCTLALKEEIIEI